MSPSVASFHPCPTITRVTDHRPDLAPELVAALAGRFEIVRELGRGGMATGCLGNDVRHGREVAGYVKAGGFASPVHSTMPDSKSAQKKGSNQPIPCTLQSPAACTVAHYCYVIVNWNDGSKTEGWFLLK